ncbi:MAG TPA: hypothetical protein VFS51_08805 [Gemmatimonadales bacterium]|nr:hypothetical protein [Gemmatimonadales bacterium]
MTGHTLTEDQSMRAAQTHSFLGSALCFALALSMLACSDSTGPAASRNEPGTGTATLRVTGEIEGQDVAGGFVTQMVVSVRDAAGAPVSGAAVIVRNGALGTVNLLELSAASGDYEATVNTFASGDYRLDVTKGIDNVQGVVVGGLSAHRILGPRADTTITANQPFTITWTRPSEAVAAELETHDFSVDAITDAGSYTIAAVDNPARPDQRIRLWRYNQVNIAGGLAGSELRLSIRNTVEPVVVQ